jgi:hypothetical protein
MSATERVPLGEGGQSDERRSNFSSRAHNSILGRAACPTYLFDRKQEEYFLVPVSEGNTGGGCPPCPPHAQRACGRRALRGGIQGEVVVPLSEGDIGGGKIIHTSLHSGKLVAAFEGRTLVRLLVVPMACRPTCSLRSWGYHQTKT